MPHASKNDAFCFFLDFFYARIKSKPVPTSTARSFARSRFLVCSVELSTETFVHTSLPIMSTTPAAMQDVIVFV
jgi:hypothetical protein